MDSDNLYRGNTAHLLREPSEQQLEKEKEATQVKAVMPVLEDIVKRLEERIAFYDSVTAIPDDVVTDPEKFMHVVAANKLTSSNLQVEKTFLEELISTYQ